LPAKVAQQITPLRRLLELRNSLANLKSTLIGNEKLESLLQEVIHNQEMLQRAGSEAGVQQTEEKES
jgi:type VI secretion system protein ImpB